MGNNELIRVVFKFRIGKYYLGKSVQNGKIIIILRRYSQSYDVGQDDTLTGEFKDHKILGIFSIKIFHYLTNKEYNNLAQKSLDSYKSA